MNYISFSLFGNDPKYFVGALKNAEQTRRFYPDFVSVFYVDNKVPKEFLKALTDRGARLSYMRGSQISNLKMWRFLAITKPNADVVLVRDADSRFSERETKAVEQWLASDKRFHVMRDYPAHDRPIMGGTWGWKKGLSLGMYDEITNWLRQGNNRQQTSDQTFLAEAIWPKVQHTALQHDSFFRDKFPGSIPFPAGDQTADGSFVGEIFDADGKPQLNCRYARTIGMKAEDVK